DGGGPEASTDRRNCRPGLPPRAGDLELAGLRSKRCAVHLRAAPYRVLPALGLLCRSHPQGREARRSADRAADEIRACPQCESCQDTGSHLSARAARVRRRGHRMTAYGTKRTSGKVCFLSLSGAKRTYMKTVFGWLDQKTFIRC